MRNVRSKSEGAFQPCEECLRLKNLPFSPFDCIRSLGLDINQREKEVQFLCRKWFPAVFGRACPCFFLVVFGK